MTTHTTTATAGQAELDAARLLLARMGISPADLLSGATARPPAPTFAEYVPVVATTVTDSSRRAYTPTGRRSSTSGATDAWTNPPRRRSSNSASTSAPRWSCAATPAAGPAPWRTSSPQSDACTTRPSTTTSSARPTTRPARSPNPAGSKAPATPYPTPASPKSTKSQLPPATTPPSTPCSCACTSKPPAGAAVPSPSGPSTLTRSSAGSCCGRRARRNGGSPSPQPSWPTFSSTPGNAMHHRMGACSARTMASRSPTAGTTTCGNASANTCPGSPANTSAPTGSATPP